MKAKKGFKREKKQKGLMEVIKEVFRNGLSALNDKFKIAITDKRNEIEKKLEELSKDKNSIFCNFCKDHLGIEKIRGLYKYGNEVIIFCDKTSCQMDAYHKLIDLESKTTTNGIRT